MAADFDAGEDLMNWAIAVGLIALMWTIMWLVDR